MLRLKLNHVSKRGHLWVLSLDLFPALVIETVSPEGTFCDTVQVPSGAGDMQLILDRD